MLLRHAIGAVLRRLRLERGETLRQLSETASVSIPYLSEIERGRKEASSEILATLCRVFDISEGELLTRVAAEFATADRVGLRPVETRTAAPVRELAPAGSGSSSGSAGAFGPGISVDLRLADLLDAQPADLRIAEPPQDGPASAVLLAA
ncbi:helix-turn-helix transcriptional regulator [Leifsonia sp. PS1209]|uniref:helix-turn-helix domain-containing protein n=1 Tax=Leifsonia sp. PS1209 TaxID=2724914 RepID=UPI001442DA24|nr:helix-turn-helix transcriptional regulator [Leifsonia sp. PS1209]QIZ97584.1 helix-turn-helix transcriptional regulator [Leifsonia sp. PS1209]